jgi:hypothetical protein
VSKKLSNALLVEERVVLVLALSDAEGLLGALDDALRAASRRVGPAVDVREDLEVAGRLERVRQVAGVGEVVGHDVPVALETEVEELAAGGTRVSEDASDGW